MLNKWCLLLFLCSGISEYFFRVVIIGDCITQSELTFYEKLKGLRGRATKETKPAHVALHSSLCSCTVVRKGSHRVFLRQKIDDEIFIIDPVISCLGNLEKLNSIFLVYIDTWPKRWQNWKTPQLFWPHFCCVITNPAVGQHGRASLPPEVHSEASCGKHFALLPSGQRSWNQEGRIISFPRESVVEPTVHARQWLLIWVHTPPH